MGIAAPNGVGLNAFSECSQKEQKWDQISTGTGTVEIQMPNCWKA